MKTLLICLTLAIVACSHSNDSVTNVPAVPGPTPLPHGVQAVNFIASRNVNNVQNGTFSITNQVSMAFPSPSDVGISLGQLQAFTMTVIVHGILCTYTHNVNSVSMNSTTCPLTTPIVSGDSILFSIDPIAGQTQVVSIGATVNLNY